MPCWVRDKRRVGFKQSEDKSTKDKPDNSAQGQDTNSKVSPAKNQPGFACSTWSDEYTPPQTPADLNADNAGASVSDYGSVDGRTRHPPHTTLPASLIAALESPQCQFHADKRLELYCIAHQLPVCTLCACTSHRGCKDMKTIEDVVQERTNELWDLVHTLKEQEAALAWQRAQLEERLRAMHINDPSSDRRPDWMKHGKGAQPMRTHVSPTRVSASSTTYRLEWSTEGARERRKLPNVDESYINVFSESEEIVGSPSQSSPTSQSQSQALAKSASFQRASATSPQRSGGGGSGSSPGLCATPGCSLDRVPALRQPAAPTQPTISEPRRAKTTGRGFRSRVPGDRLYGPELAKVLQVGHRVKRSQDEEGYGLGTVTAIPSARIATRGKDPSGLVDVRWDAGPEGCYRMGRHNHYDLDLA